MTLFALTVAVQVLAQDGQAPSPQSSSEASSLDRAVAAAERAAQAAEKSALAAQKIAEAMAPRAQSEAKAETPQPSAWKVSTGAGLQFITGNAQTLTLTANIAAERAWDPWLLSFKLNGAYALSNPNPGVENSVADTTARRAQGLLRGDRSFGGFAGLYALASSEFDHVKNIESRTVGEFGTGLTFIDTKNAEGKEELFLRLDLGLRAGYETRFQYFPRLLGVTPYGIAILAPRAAAAFRWNMNSHVRLSEDLEFMPFVLQETAGRLLINSTSKLASKVTENVSLTVSLLINFDSKPPPSTVVRKDTDVALTAGLEANF